MGEHFHEVDEILRIWGLFESRTHLLPHFPKNRLWVSKIHVEFSNLNFWFPGKKHLEKAVQHCLALLNLTLQKENLFMDLLRESQLALIVSPLEQLLQGINPRTKKALRKSVKLKWTLKGDMKWARGRSILSWKSGVQKEPGLESPALPVSFSPHLVPPTDLLEHIMLSHKPLSVLRIVCSPSITC